MATVDGADAGETTVDLSGSTGRYVLVWITDVGSEGGYRFELQELSVTAS